ncbi:hypothetical protein ACFY8W_24115 [Streptomyces sp. NPDC012637]|uniref:hypothetical protein n=1 Tax=Streptomyces sp. NPDC012637 TaxID=3364842 RepID=UPI0036EF73BE
MVVLILSGVLVLALAGCGCVVWAARGGPRWVRAVATVTLAAGALVRGAQRAGRKPSPNAPGDGGGNGAGE